VRDKLTEIKTNQTIIIDLQSVNAALSNDLESLVQKQKALKTVEVKKNKLATFGNKFDNAIQLSRENRKFFLDSTSCPTCSQEISTSTRQKHIDQCDSKILEINEGLDKLNQELQTIETQESTLLNEIEKFQSAQLDIVANNASITQLQRTINKLESEILKIEGTDGDLGGATADLKALQIDKERLAELKLDYIDQQNYNFLGSEMLKDTGIKTKIVKQYLPVVNKLVNQFLQTLDFFVLFNLDESFNETIKSRYRDEFTYASFSEGEKQRIDLSLLFTWRQIARMKNSANTNLLILDETFDSSLDNDGIDNLMKILNTVTLDTNVFIISHKGDVLDSKFRNKIEFIKERNFSRIK
jgi:hypothetical protein